VNRGRRRRYIQAGLVVFGLFVSGCDRATTAHSSSASAPQAWSMKPGLWRIAYVDGDHVELTCVQSVLGGPPPQRSGSCVLREYHPRRDGFSFVTRCQSDAPLPTDTRMSVRAQGPDVVLIETTQGDLSDPKERSTSHERWTFEGRCPPDWSDGYTLDLMPSNGRWRVEKVERGGKHHLVKVYTTLPPELARLK
jgi:hypothetical protein